MKFPYQKFTIGNPDPTQPLVARPFIAVHLSGNGKRTRSPYFALLDSGADRVIFPADLATELSIANIASGKPEPTMGIGNQKADVYYYKLALQVLGDVQILPTEIGFSKDIVIPLLGRTFFKHFKTVTFNENKEEVELRH